MAAAQSMSQSLIENDTIPTSNISTLLPYGSHLPNDSAFTIYHNVFNPESILYTNARSDFGITIGLLKFIIQGIGVTSLCIFGVIGNLLSIVILSSSRMGNTSTTFFLRCLAICDTFAVICLTLVVGIPSLLVFNPNGGTPNSTWLVFNKRIVQYSRILPTPPVFQTAVICSVLFTMALTMDRYLAVCKPFLVLKYDLCSLKKARVVSLCLLIGDILYNMPRYWEQEYVQLETDFDNLTCYIPVPTSLRTNFYYDAIYVHMSYVIILFLTPVVYLAVFNIIICRQVWQSRKLRETVAHSTISKTQDISLSYMLFGIVVVFILCQIIPVSHASYRYATGDVGTEAYVPEVEFLMTFFFTFNSSVNFLIYCVSGTKFRTAMIYVMRCNW